MLDKLKRQFTVISLGLSSAILMLALVMSFITNCGTQSSITMSLLDRSLERGMAVTPTMGSKDREGTVGADSMLTITVDVSGGGVMLSRSESPVDINEDDLNEVIQQAMSSGDTHGYDMGRHVAWATKTTTYGLRIALCDTYSRDQALKKQAISSLSIFIVSLGLLYGVCRWFATWAVRPVEKAWDAQRRFISDASHELKTPLAVIIANTQILQRSEGVATEDKRWVDSTADEADHMKGLVEDLLTLARADEAKAGTVTAAGPMVDVDLTAVVEESALEFDAVAFERGCRIDSKTAENIMVKGDKGQLSRVVHTLLDNATKYAAKGSAVKVSLTREGKRAHLSVNNAGAAIDPEDLSHIFDRFYRTDKARSREETGGFGLGLAIAKSIVEASGGRIWAESTAADGTTFHVLLRA